MVDYRHLEHSAKSVLRNNWVDLGKGLGYTQPAQGIYPYQWNWDSAFAAYGFAHYDPTRSLTDLRTLFQGQWQNGFLPHILFWDVPAQPELYYPGPQLWEVQKVTELAPKKVATSGITQPPLQAMALWHIYKEILARQGPAPAKKILAEFYPRLYKLHQFLHQKRDPEGSGLITIFHPWESGFDNSPRWDEALERIIPNNLPKYQRLDIRFVKSAQRPRKKQYDKYIYLALKLKQTGYDSEKSYAEHPFKVKDLTFSSILYLADKRLLYMAQELDQPTSEIKGWLERFEKGVFQTCWHQEDQMFYDFDLISQKHLRTQTASSLVPFSTGLIPSSIFQKTIKLLEKADYCGQGACAYELLPSVAIQSPVFEDSRYWRGPIWLNLNWLLWRGLQAYGYHQRARHLAQEVFRLVSDQGFYEFFSPLTGQGLGAKNFSWTAAVTLDMLYHTLSSG